jgi:hypothetical protein
MERKKLMVKDLHGNKISLQSLVFSTFIACKKKATYIVQTFLIFDAI